mmetsp:Transcript_10577/g.17502  ORF Transcript_10577/g.17502 Transcript_10577/m.17502 type:complete len:282 (-) Transcript_10577:269-1114(-)
MRGYQLGICLKEFHGLDVFQFILPHSAKDIVQVVNFRTTGQAGSIRYLKGVKHIQIAIAVIINGNLRSRHALELLFIFLEECIVCRVGMLFNGVIQVVGKDWIDKVEGESKDVVPDSNVLGDESIEPGIGTAQFLHNQKMVQLIPAFGKMEPQIFGLSPATNCFVEMQGSKVGEIRNTSNRFESIKAGKIAFFSSKYIIKESCLQDPDKTFVEVNHLLRKGRTKCCGWRTIVVSPAVVIVWIQASDVGADWHRKGTPSVADRRDNESSHLSKQENSDKVED